jgi:uncharacterized protein (DUF1810 family)
MDTKQVNETTDPADPFKLGRFLSAQAETYDRALAEIKRGRKDTHWMWFIFPQIEGLGFSETTRFYSIKRVDEARQYLNHPVLGPRLIECVEAVLLVEGSSVREIFGSPDDLKLQSSMTLFSFLTGDAFEKVLEKYFHGENDEKTLELLDRSKDA